MNEKEEFLGLGWFIHELAKRADFTLDDTRMLYDKMVEIISEIVEQKKTLMLTGFIKITAIPVRREKSWDGLNKKWLGVQEFSRLKISPSINLRRLYSITLKKQMAKKQLSIEEEFE